MLVFEAFVSENFNSFNLLVIAVQLPFASAEFKSQIQKSPSLSLCMSRGPPRRWGAVPSLLLFIIYNNYSCSLSFFFCLCNCIQDWTPATLVVRQAGGQGWTEEVQSWSWRDKGGLQIAFCENNRFVRKYPSSRQAKALKKDNVVWDEYCGEMLLNSRDGNLTIMGNAA